jgi:sn-glycerol 3-phosphate transport system permease protein
MNLWKSVGYYSLIVLSALKSIPAEIYEAARLDNASPLKTFFKITLPMLSPQLFFMLVTITTGSFMVFDSIRIMTNGGPGASTQVLSLFIYDYAFMRNNMLGFGSSAGVVLMVALMLITLLDFHGLEKRVHYQ